MTLADRALTTRFPGRTAGRLAACRGPRPAWYRPALLALLAATALLYLWDLSASGNANSFYAAAVQAGSKSWKAWFFGSLDSSSFITVDKPPGALWVMGLSARLFGYSSWSLLVPQALEGVAAVGLLAGAVRRVAGPAAGLIAGAVLALTPAAVLIFRFDNPDAFLVLLLVAAAYSVTRALEAGRTRWLVLAGAAVGLAFLTKSGQALLPVPALGLAYLVAAPVSLRRRIGQLLLAGVAMVIAAGWWIVAVLAWPAARPALHRRQHRQQSAAAGVRVQRPGPAPRRIRQRRRRDRRRGRRRHRLRRGDRPRAAVPRGIRPGDLLAAAGRPAPAGRGHLADLAQPAGRPGPGRVHHLGRLAAGDGRDLQLHGRHHSPLLHRRAGAGYRGPRRDRRGDRVAAAR